MVAKDGDKIHLNLIPNNWKIEKRIFVESSPRGVHGPGPGPRPIPGPAHGPGRQMRGGHYNGQGRAGK